MKLVTRNILYRTGATPGPTPPTPSITVQPIVIDGTKVFTLDYKITTGEEMGVADIMYNQEWSYYTNKSGWAKMIGYHSSSYGQKWFLGCYKGGVLNPGTQFGRSGDRTLSISGYNDYVNKINKRCLWKYGNRFLRVYETTGNWQQGTEVGNATTATSSTWTDIIGQNLTIPVTYQAGWTNIFLFYGLRIYAGGDMQGNPTGALLADYTGALLNGVEGIYNYTTGQFIAGV